MAVYSYPVQLNWPRFYEEWAAAFPGVPLESRFRTLAEHGVDEAVLIVPDTVSQAAVNALVAAHDPQQLSSSQQIDTAYTVSLTALRTEYQAIKQGAENARALLGTEAEWLALTATQREVRTRQILLGLVNHFEAVADALRAVVR